MKIRVNDRGSVRSIVLGVEPQQIKYRLDILMTDIQNFLASDFSGDSTLEQRQFIITITRNGDAALDQQ